MTTEAAIRTEAAITAEEVLEMADTTATELVIAAHQTNYVHLIVKLDDNNIIDAFTTDSADEYWQSATGEWDKLATFGTGSCTCNCDACERDEDPVEWASDEAYDIIEIIDDKIDRFFDDIKEWQIGE